MDTASEVLLIIVSSVLSVFLIVLIITLGYFISILKQVKRITERAENMADTMESAAENIKNASSRVAVFKMIAKLVETAAKNGKKG